MTKLSNNIKTEIAIKMVTIDAIEKGHTNTNELISYMQSNVFKNSVANYKKIIN